MTSSDEADEHISMLAYRGFGQRLISRAIALELARSILKEIFGEASLSDKDNSRPKTSTIGGWSPAACSKRQEWGHIRVLPLVQ